MLAREPAEHFKVLLLVGRVILTLRLPQRFCKTIDHLMFRGMLVAEPPCQLAVDAGDTRRAVRDDLFPNAKMQSHVQKRIRFATLRCVVTIQPLGRYVTAS